MRSRQPEWQAQRPTKMAHRQDRQRPCPGGAMAEASSGGRSCAAAKRSSKGTACPSRLARKATPAAGSRAGFHGPVQGRASVQRAMKKEQDRTGAVRCRAGAVLSREAGNGRASRPCPDQRFGREWTARIGPKRERKARSPAGCNCGSAAGGVDVRRAAHPLETSLWRGIQCLGGSQGRYRNAKGGNANRRPPLTKRDGVSHPVQRRSGWVGQRDISHAARRLKTTQYSC